MQLAPAAGAGIGKVIADKLLADPAFVPSMLDAVTNALKATRGFWTGKGESAEYVTEPDYKTQLNAFALLLAHMEGEPIKRIVHQHLNAPAADPLQALRDSPALREAMRRELDKADRKAKRATPAPADPDPVEV